MANVQQAALSFFITSPVATNGICHFCRKLSCMESFPHSFPTLSQELLSLGTPMFTIAQAAPDVHAFNDGASTSFAD